MDWRPVLVATGGVGAFVALALAGAFVIVNLAPPERPAAVGGDKVLLMESASALRPFDAPPARPREPEALTERPQPLPARAESVPPSAGLLSMLKDDPPPAVAAPPASVVRPTRREAPRTVVALAPSAPAEARPPVATPAPAPTLAPAPVPLIRPRPEPRNDGVLTPSTVRQFHLSLRLTREQEPYWLPVEQALLEIGAQQAAMVRAGQDPKEAFGVGAAMRMYGVARPLLDVLREDQKARVRAQARSMGFGSVASQI